MTIQQVENETQELDAKLDPKFKKVYHLLRLAFLCLFTQEVDWNMLFLFILFYVGFLEDTTWYVSSLS